MLTAILLILIGGADLARSAIASKAGRSVTIGSGWVAVLVLAAAGLGVPVWCLVIPVVLASVWLITTTTSIDRHRTHAMLPTIGLLLALLALLAADRTAQDLSGFIVDWHDSAASAVVRALALPSLAIALGVALFAVESSNLVVRATFRATPSSPGAEVLTVPRSRWFARDLAPAPTVADLRGGRLIGPLERVLIIALTLAGALPIVAGLIAAKGIVRFPEISKDGIGGSKAEYFLVGSLVSWTIAVTGAGLIFISARG